jgi:hypothetical protein
MARLNIANSTLCVTDRSVYTGALAAMRQEQRGIMSVVIFGLIAV